MAVHRGVLPSQKPLNCKLVTDLNWDFSHGKKSLNFCFYIEWKIRSYSNSSPDSYWMTVSCSWVGAAVPCPVYLIQTGQAIPSSLPAPGFRLCAHRTSFVHLHPRLHLQPQACCCGLCIIWGCRSGRMCTLLCRCMFRRGKGSIWSPWRTSNTLRVKVNQVSLCVSSVFSSPLLFTLEGREEDRGFTLSRNRSQDLKNPLISFSKL